MPDRRLAAVPVSAGGVLNACPDSLRTVRALGTAYSTNL